MDLYVGSLRTKNTQAQAQQELFRFIQWCGVERQISALAPPEIGEYGEQAVGSVGGMEASERLQEVRKFLSFAKKKGLIERNLSTHLRIRKAKGRTRGGSSGNGRNVQELTKEGHAQLVLELEEQKAKRPPLAEEIHRAAADKDVRENVPLEAAREQLGLVESRIAEIEEVLKSAVIIDKSRRDNEIIRIGSVVVVKDLGSGRETRYTLVGATEANPLERRISNVSPVGKALLNKVSDDEIEVETPRGKQRFKVVKVS